MPHKLYQNATQDLSWDVFLRDRNGVETTPAVASGLFSLLDNDGSVVVPQSDVTVSSSNTVTFRVRPTSGTATTGVFKEVWDVFFNSQSFQYIDYLTIKERY
jgi:hypothetical protein